MRILAIVLAACCLLSVSSCFGGIFGSHPLGGFLVPTPQPPLITTVTPSSIISGQTASFVTDPFVGGDGDSFKWDFGGGVSPDKSTLPSPVVTALAPGTYGGVVVAVDEYGKTTFPFTYTVTAP